MQAGLVTFTGFLLPVIGHFFLLFHPCYCRPSTGELDKDSQQKPAHMSKDRVLKRIPENFLKINSLKPKTAGLKKLNYSVIEKRNHIRKYKKVLQDKDIFDKLFEPELDFPINIYHFRHEDSLKSQTEEASNVYFSLDISDPDDPNRETIVTHAELSFYRIIPKPSEKSKDQKSQIKLFHVNPTSSNNNSDTLKLLYTRELSSALSDLEWESFDVTSSVKHWLENSTENLGFKLVHDIGLQSGGVGLYSSHSRFSSLEPFLRNKEFLPSLKVKTQQRHILGRSKRAPAKNDCKVGDGENRCCRYPLWVDFRDIGWDEWVVAPDGYQGYFCDGKCPDRYKPANNFAGIKSILHMINPASVPVPCCSATKMDSIDLLHYDETGNLVVSEYAGMIVQDCKCS